MLMRQPKISKDAFIIVKESLWVTNLSHCFGDTILFTDPNHTSKSLWFIFSMLIRKLTFINLLPKLILS